MINDKVKVFENKKILKDEEIALIQDLISNLKYGLITLKIQDGVLVQIDKNEKIRFKVVFLKGGENL